MDLIQKFCPDGVEYKELGAVAAISRGGNFQKRDYVKCGFPCVHYGQIYTTYNLFVTDVLSHISFQTAERQRKAVHGDIIMAITSENIEDICKCIAYLGDEEIAVSGHTAIIHHTLEPKYLAYYLNSSLFSRQKWKLVQGTKVIEASLDKLKKVKVPVPPLEIQKEIVRILDTFNGLTSELTSELIARKKQYAYYRKTLLEFKENDNMKMVRLGDVCDVLRGSRLTRTELLNEGYPVFHGGPEPLGYYHEANRKADTTVVINTGNAGKVCYVDQPFWSSDACFSLYPKEGLMDRFLYFCVMQNEPKLFAKIRAGTIPMIDADAVKSLQIPLFPLPAQQHIVSILNRFDTLCNDLTGGLPAEIEVRRKQYEYYRDKLLTFESA